MFSLESSFSLSLFELMKSKKSNLCIAVDVTMGKECLEWIKLIGNRIVLVKVGCIRHSWINEHGIVTDACGYIAGF